MILGMRAGLKERLFRSTLRRVLPRPCPDLVPLSGDEGARVNCFVTYVIAYDGRPYLLLDSLVGEFVKCRRWDGKSFSIEMHERVRNLVDKNLNIVHHDGLEKTVFTGAWDFLWQRYTAFFSIRVGVRRGWQAGFQFLVNLRTRS